MRQQMNIDKRRYAALLLLTWQEVQWVEHTPWHETKTIHSCFHKIKMKSNLFSGGHSE